MFEDADSPFGAGKQILESEYLVLAQQMTQLLESRVIEREYIEAIHRWWTGLAPSGSTSSLWQLTSESESLLRLNTQTSDFRDRYRLLQRRMSELGQKLGYW